jgi:hypothetical protein
LLIVAGKMISPFLLFLSDYFRDNLTHHKKKLVDKTIFSRIGGKLFSAYEEKSFINFIINNTAHFIHAARYHAYHNHIGEHRPL